MTVLLQKSIDNHVSNLGLHDFNFQPLPLVSPLVKQNGIVKQIIQTSNKLSICLENLFYFPAVLSAALTV